MFHLDHLPNPIPDEHVVHFLRRHIITIIPLILGYAFLISAPFALVWYINTYQPTLLQHAVISPLIVLGSSVFFLFAWLFLFQAFMDYYLDVWIVTNRRVLSIEQNGLFSRTISELRLYRVQDVTSTITGLLHTIFGYGNVEVQTAGEKEHFIFEDIPHAQLVAKAILENSEVDRREHLDDAVEEFALSDKSKKIGANKTVGGIVEP